MTPKTKTKKCQCDLCRKWFPMQRRILKKLSGKDLRLFHEYVLKEQAQSDDLAAAQAKLSGDWTGWEWMKQAVKDHIESLPRQRSWKEKGTE